MTLAKLSRTNIAALWRHMPGQPFAWERRAVAIGDGANQVTALEVPERWVVPQLRRLIAPFAEAVNGAPNTGPELAVIDRLMFDLVKAEDLQAKRFPNTFLCGACGRFTTVGERDPEPCCPDHGLMRQFTFVEIHECGHLAELRAPRCDNGCRAAMALINSDNLSTSRWFWRCTRCHTQSRRGLTRRCPTCNGGVPRIMRSTQGDAFHAQTITVLNPPKREDYSQLANEHVYAAAIAQTLGALPPGIDGLRQATGIGADDPVAKVRETALLLGMAEDDPMLAGLIAKAQDQAATGAPAWRASVDSLGLTPERLEAIGDECRQLSLARAASELTVDDLQANSAGTILAADYARYRPMFAQHGLADVTLLRQLPIAYVVSGYTRGSARAIRMSNQGPVATNFRFFPPSSNGKVRMYGVRTDTEGLLFRLDPLAVVDWLTRTRLISEQHLPDADAARRWLLTHVEPVTDIFNPPTDPVTRAVLGLTHSFCHRAMKSLAARCGLNVDSLGEYLFPANASFLVYANTRSQFVLGGLEHVYRYDLPDAFSDLATDSKCIFDPPCRTSFGGSCAACLHVSEVACERFNTVLDRNMLFGSLPPAAGAATADTDAVAWQPYWNV